MTLVFLPSSSKFPIFDGPSTGYHLHQSLYISTLPCLIRNGRVIGIFPNESALIKHTGKISTFSYHLIVIIDFRRPPICIFTPILPWFSIYIYKLYTGYILITINMRKFISLNKPGTRIYKYFYSFIYFNLQMASHTISLRCQFMKDGKF